MRDWLCLPVGAWEPTNPLPESALPPPIGDKWSAIALLKAVLEDLCDALMRLEVPNPDAPLEVDPLGAEGFTGGKLHRPSLGPRKGQPVPGRGLFLHMTSVHFEGDPA